MFLFVACSDPKLATPEELKERPISYFDFVPSDNSFLLDVFQSETFVFVESFEDLSKIANYISVV